MLGIAASLTNTSAYSFAAQAYSHEMVEKKIASFEGMFGFAATMGPILGSIVYEAIGFKWTFFSFAIAMSPGCLLVLFLLPKPSDVRKKHS